MEVELRESAFASKDNLNMDTTVASTVQVAVSVPLSPESVVSFPDTATTSASNIVVGTEMARISSDSTHESIRSFGHEHYSHRLPWLRAAVLGANDGLVSTASVMLGVTLGRSDLNFAVLSGISALVAGALAMAAGEYVSVSSQRDSEQADIKREAAEFAKGPKHRQRELEDLVEIFIRRGLQPSTARLVAEEMHSRPIEEIVKVHAREELGIDPEELADPFQASWTSALSFAAGAALPLLAGSFLHDVVPRVISILVISSIGLVLFGALGAVAGGAPAAIAAFRVLVGGLIAMGGTMGAGKLFGATTS